MCKTKYRHAIQKSCPDLNLMVSVWDEMTVTSKSDRRTLRTSPVFQSLLTSHLVQINFVHIFVWLWSSQIQDKGVSFAFFYQAHLPKTTESAVFQITLHRWKTPTKGPVDTSVICRGCSRLAALPPPLSARPMTLISPLPPTLPDQKLDRGTALDVISLSALCAHWGGCWEDWVRRWITHRHRRSLWSVRAHQVVMSKRASCWWHAAFKGGDPKSGS